MIFFSLYLVMIIVTYFLLLVIGRKDFYIHCDLRGGGYFLVAIVWPATLTFFLGKWVFSLSEKIETWFIKYLDNREKTNDSR